MFIKELFGGLKMTWPRVIIFAVCAGVYTALMAMLTPDTCSLHDIAVTVEVWILLAIIVIANCEKPLEAACKTFVFFLISQPLVYLIQVPFSWMGWGLFGYYRYWFIITLLTFPGAYIGWFIKKDNVLSGVILSVMLVLLVWSGIGFAKESILHFPNHLLSAIYCFGIIPVMIYGIFSDKKPRITAAAISLAAFVIILAVTLSQPIMSFTRNFLLDEEKYPLDTSWTVSSEDEKISSPRLYTDPDGNTQLIVEFHEPGANTVVLRDGEGKEYRLIISCDLDRRVEVIDEQGEKQ